MWDYFHFSTTFCSAQGGKGYILQIHYIASEMLAVHNVSNTLTWTLKNLEHETVQV